MGIFLDSFPGALEPRRTPFDEAGAPTEPVVFIYMTNRSEGRWSHLMAPGFEQVHDPINHISMGYTQLWIMLKLEAIYPDGVRRRKLRAAHVPEAPSFERGVTRDDYMALFHVLREPGAGPHGHNDHIGARRTLHDAIEFARVYADFHRCRTVVAKLVHDWQWH